ncbi:hypothetical protein C8R46DRAFT_1211171 [Mycena filopes]|nr:hypothetical protein C8R46DRAFT_1211171 [Mycena filopes]
MSTYYKSFAVVGAGVVGLPIATGLAASHPAVSVIILSRTSDSKTPPPGVQLVQVDTSDAAAVTAVLKHHKVEVVVSTINAATPAGAAAQRPVVDASKDAEVKLYVPKYVKAAGLPTVRFFNGLFINHIGLLRVEGDGKVKVIGKGDTPLSVTSVADAAGFVAHVLTTLPPFQLENRIFRIEGDRATLREIAALFGTGVEYVDPATAAGATDEWTKFVMFALTMFEKGAGSTGWDWRRGEEGGEGEEGAGSANGLWAGHQWETIREFYKR